MILLKTSILICLLAVAPVFYAARNEETNEENTEVAVHRVKKELSSELKSELSSIFNLKNYLQTAQKIGKVVIYFFQKVANFFKPKLVEEAIVHLKFPGSNFVGSFIRKLLDIGNDVLKYVAKSNFMTKKPTQQNLHNLIFDIGIIITEHVYYITTSLYKAAEKALDSRKVKFDALKNAKFKCPIFTDILETVHSLSGQISKGIIKLSSPAVRNTIYRFISESTLPFNKEIADIIKIAIINLNFIAKDITRTKFVKEDPNWNNVNEFVVVATKSAVLNCLKSGEDIFQAIFKILLQLRGITREMKSHPDFFRELPVEKGTLVKVIHNMLSYLPHIPMQKIMHIVHKALSISSRLLIEITENKGVRNLHKTVETIGNVITNILSKAAKGAVEELHKFAKASAQSKFITEPPTWDNAKIYTYDMSKTVVNLAKRLAIKIKYDFDKSIARLIRVPNWFLELVAIIVPKYYLEKAQHFGKSTASGLESITGPHPQRAIKEFVIGSGLPQSQVLGEILMRNMIYMHEVAGVIKRSKFLIAKPTIPNLACTIIEAIKVLISEGLDTFSDSMAIIETIFQFEQN